MPATIKTISLTPSPNSVNLSSQIQICIVCSQHIYQTDRHSCSVRNNLNERLIKIGNLRESNF